MSPLTMPQWSMITALVMTRSQCSGLIASSNGHWARPSRIDLPPPKIDFLAVDGVVLLDLDDQLGVGQPDAVADRRAIFLGVGSRESFTLMDRCPLPVRDGIGRDAARHLDGLVTVSLFDAPLQAGLARVGVVEAAHDQAVEPVDHAPAAVGDQLDVLDVAGLEPDRRAAGQVQPHAVGLLAVEDQRRIGLEEVVMGADLDGTVAGVVDAERHDGAAGVQLDVRPVEEVFARNHFRPPEVARVLTAEPIVSGSDRGR